ncbi:MAG: hypothetical protein GY781_13980 [Gammaproteobacteria bacterium]|nr:hypothetical protein [Gammaproteobacteria bacterium]
MMKKTLFILTVFIISGCVTTEQANQRISAWDNVTLTDLINAWGVPTKEQEIAERKFYIWNSQGTSNTPAIGISAGSFGGRGGISIGTLFGGSTEENFCSRVVEVDSDEKVNNIQWTGKPGLCFDMTPERVIQ